MSVYIRNSKLKIGYDLVECLEYLIISLVVTVGVDRLNVPLERARLRVRLLADVALVRAHIKVLPHVHNQGRTARELMIAAFDVAAVVVVELLAADLLRVELSVGALRKRVEPTVDLGHL